MADDTPTLTPGSGYDSSPANPDAPDESSSEAPADTPAPATPTQSEEDDDKKFRETQRQGLESINKSLNDIEQQRGKYDERWKTEVEPYVNRLKESVNAPLPAPPQLQEDTPPLQRPTQQQQGHLATGIVNMLKFGALLAIAYGTSARRGGIVRKAALAGAMQGFSDALQNNDKQSLEQSKLAFELWEKQREFDRDERKMQLDNYHAILNDRHLRLTDQMDMIKILAQQYGEYKNQADAQEKNLTAVQKNIKEMQKLHDDAEKEHRALRKTVAGIIGKGKEEEGYYTWLRDKFGVKLDPGDPEEEYDKLPKEQRMSAYHKELDKQKADERREDKAADETRELNMAFKKSKAEALGKKAAEKEADDNAVDPDNPLDLNLGPRKKLGQ